YNAMQESLAKVAEQELFNEDEIEEFERKVISKPSGRETSALQDGIASASLEKELGETELPRADRSVLEDLVAKDSREPRSGRRRRNIKAQNSEPRLKGTDISIPRTTFPREGQAYISRLNEALEKSLFDPKKHRKELWRWYSLSRKTLASDFGLVPAPTWKLLWDEFSVDALDNPDRMAHIIDLAEGMQAANFPLKPDQTLLYMEALFVEDDEAEALQLWESSRSSLTLEDETAGAYWALGVRMLSEMKQPARAQEAADMLLGNLGAVKEVRALLPLIRAWSEFPDKTANQIAWAMYIRFKLWKGDGMEMQDYDDVAAIFLAAQQTDLALAVFRDMMLTGDEMAKQYDSVTLFQRLVGVKSTKALKSFQLAPEETSWRSSEHLSLLPAKFRNKFFFGSWIKKLVGEEQIDWAAQVVELMSQKGIKPSATYLNGIIGAWFRSGIQRNIEKGTTLAWKMISARLDFVRQRTQNSAPLELSNPIRANKTIGKDDYIRPSSLSYAGAQATLETFTVLIEHYQKINHKGRVQELLATLKAAQIRPTTPFMNNLLELGTAIHNRPWVWSLYERFVQQDAVPATQYTFAILWKNMKDHVDPVINRNKVGYPSPRLLFSEMGRAPIFKTEQLARELYDQIILCFGLSDDQIGTAVALRAMQNIHGIYPNEATVRSVVLQLAKVGVTNVKGYRTRRLNINKDTQRRIAEIGNVMKALKEERVKALEAEGVDAESLSAQEKSEESLKLLISLLRFAMEGRMKTDSNLRASAGVGGVDYLRKEACKDMDVELSSW
ncbi:MAG: hypothetical protein H9W83_07015, partial [Leuconostoc sp.]|nr:hypothetical protein [Leuconostoc sp.]